MIGPAEKLSGRILNARWLVADRLARDSGDDAISRSACYRAVASGSGQQAFIKAYDFRHDELAGDTEKLQRMVSEFNNEKRVHEHCKSKKLSRVTQIYDHGVEIIDGKPVHFIVCECADRSLRSYHPPGQGDVPVWERLIALRQTASALVQLHTAGVAHQDIKPSNAVYFEDGRVKITDLGSASCIHLPAPPHDEERYVGQPNFAPYELVYSNGIDPQWQRRRYGCDVFLLGNLIFTSLVGGSITALMVHAIPPQLLPAAFDGPYREVIPDLERAHLLIPDFINEVAPKCIANDINKLIESLCHPDPRLRGLGSLNANGERNYDLNRAVGTLNTLALRAKLDATQELANTK
ncbi:hypothetical protein VDF98_20100 [Xanthomonas campestris pv. raphani]|uniref:protein kinase domain-containing protein n=1 Tax=Xanthomonas TaxID=338 RepID=UPI000CEE348F|nr:MULTISPECIES: hypothetical protein [Xanthomonas]MCE4347988.1 hypothetical protein [Xanthomonas hortorum pv. cynarae]MEA9825732.1 hypothetical protein [Xanthomonas campestris pv. raphani]MEA9853998.1 hypothetical protein [Xanthomonas campestris pv. raphani]MEA9858202.1 hypothetical protein [Xanthomonas campestris pv. raphani]MEA9967187.1 hypothetical protein [Xanthomonas campestris pv. raphani]